MTEHVDITEPQLIHGSYWERQDLPLITSWYSVTEAKRIIALKKPSASEHLSALIGKVEVSTNTTKMESGHCLPDKDVPILEAAVWATCSFLLTGDITHFGHLLGKEIEGVAVLTPAMFLGIGGQ